MQSLDEQVSCSTEFKDSSLLVWGSRKEDNMSVLFYCTKVAETSCSHVRGSPFVCVFPHHPLLDVARLETGITDREARAARSSQTRSRMHRRRAHNTLYRVFSRSAHIELFSRLYTRAHRAHSRAARSTNTRHAPLHLYIHISHYSVYIYFILE